MPHPIQTPRLIRSTRRSTLDAIVIALVCLVVATALLGPLLAPESVFRSNVLEALQPPSAAHWFGTDDQGRDVLWRLVAGARETLLAAMLVVACYSAIGCLVAVLATVGGRWLDEVLMRVTDVALALPGMVVALGFAAAMGPSLKSAIIAMILAGWPMTARLLRGVMHETMAMPFVAGARVLGVSRTRLMLRHVLPNSLDALLVKWAGDIGFTVLLLAGLSFIGVGAQPPSAEWGAMISGAKGYIATAWWVALAPGLAIAVTAAAFGLLGDLLQVRRNPALRKK
ncbi:ABC transporter permease [Saccharopolyspora sp. NPDC050389]|uniref:ABC transporter permease n=1 Tax=Saccharopolyspora sp. NPDC050389 TaxID=3155516 RepID=UPI003410820D